VVLLTAAVCSTSGVLLVFAEAVVIGVAVALLNGLAKVVLTSDAAGVSLMLLSGNLLSMGDVAGLSCASDGENRRLPSVATLCHVLVFCGCVSMNKPL